MALFLEKLCVVALFLVALGLSSPFAPEVSAPGRRSKHLYPVLERRDNAQFSSGQPIDGNGKGAPISGAVPSERRAFDRIAHSP